AAALFAACTGGFPGTCRRSRLAAGHQAATSFAGWAVLFSNGPGIHDAGTGQGNYRHAVCVVGQGGPVKAAGSAQTCATGLRDAAGPTRTGDYGPMTQAFPKAAAMTRWTSTTFTEPSWFGSPRGSYAASPSAMLTDSWTSRTSTEPSPLTSQFVAETPE